MDSCPTERVLLLLGLHHLDPPFDRMNPNSKRDFHSPSQEAYMVNMHIPYSV